MIEVTKSASFEEVASNVKQNWKLIAKRYIPSDVETNVYTFKDISNGLGFNFKLPHENKHHFKVEVRLSLDQLKPQSTQTLQSKLLKEVGKQIIYVVGNYQIDEAYDPAFTKKHHYGYRQLEALHQDEDIMLDSAQAMVLGAKFSEFNQSADAKYDFLAPFNDNQIDLIKAVYSNLIKKFNLIANVISFGGFSTSVSNSKYLMATLKFQRIGGSKSFTINIFSNQVRKFAEKFAEHGMGEEQAIYFIIRTYLSKAVKEFSTNENLAPNLELDKESYIDMIANLPKQYFKLFE